MTKETRDTIIIITICFIVLVHVHMWNIMKSPHRIAIQRHREQYEKEAEQLREKHKTAIYQELDKIHEEIYKNTIDAHKNLHEQMLLNRIPIIREIPANHLQEQTINPTHQKHQRIQVLKNIPPLSY